MAAWEKAPVVNAGKAAWESAPVVSKEPTAQTSREVADKLYDDHFALTMSRSDFYDQMGLDSQEVRQPSAGSAIKRAPSALNRGIAQGLEGIARLPAMVVDVPTNMVVDPINAVLKATGVNYQIPRSDTYGAVEQLMGPVEQSAPGRAVTGALNRLGERWAPEQPAPKNFAEQAVDYTGELVGSSLPIAAAPFLRAGSAVNAPNAQTVMGRVWQDMQRRAATAPVSTATAETTAAAGAGLGGAIAQEAAPGNYLAEMLGQLLGGVGVGLAPTLLGGRLAVGGAKKGLDYISGDAQTRRAEQKVRDTVGDIAAVEPKLREAEDVERRVNKAAAAAGVDPINLSLAERTRSPAVAAAQRDVEGRMSGPELDKAVARYQANEDAISAFAREIEPKSRRTVDQVVNRAMKPGDKVRDALDERVTRNLLERTALSGRVPTVDLAEKGRLLRDELNAQRIAVREQFNQRASDEGLDNIDVTVDFRKFQEQLDQKYRPKPYDNALYRPKVLDELLSYKMPPPVDDVTVRTGSKPKGTSITDDFAGNVPPDKFNPDNAYAPEPGPEPISFQDVKGWRERLTTDLRVAQRSNNPVDRERARALTSVLRDFDDMVVNAELSQAAPDAVAKWKKFRQDYKTQYVDVFRPPQMKDIRGRDIDGFEEMADEAVAAELFKPGNVTTARRFKNAIQAAGDDTASVRAVEAIGSVALDSLNKAAVRNGVIDQKMLDTWKRQHQSMLEEFPYLKFTVDNIAETNKALLNRNARLENRKKAFQQSVMERRLAAVETGAKTPEGLIDDAIKNHAIAARLVSRVRGDKDALAGLRQVVWKKIPLDSPEATAKFIAANKRSLDAIFTPQHVADIQAIAKARSMAETVKPPAGKPVETSPFKGLEDAIGSTLPSLSASARAIRMGRSGWAYELPARGMQAIRARMNAHADEVWKQALYDPDVARALIVAQNNRGSLQAQEKLRRTLWNYGLSLYPDMPNARIPGGFVQAEEGREE